ncbi:MAG: hemolysin family protein [Weeksellaceae bacterium]
MTSTIIIILTAILASAFFSGMEIAFISSNRMHMELERKKNTFISKVMLYLADRPQKFIATMLVGNNVALVVYGIFMGELIMAWVPSTSSEMLDLLLQTLISTLVILVTAEFLPKAIFSIYSNQLFKFFALPAWLMFQIFYLFSSVIIWISNQFLRLTGSKEGGDEEIFLKEELKYFLSEQLTEADDDEIDTEVQIFHNALEFSEIKTRECMVPRKEIIGIEITENIEVAREKFIDTGLSKLIVYQENIDHVIGYIHAFDLFKKPNTIRNVLLPVEFVNETESAKEVMNSLIKKRKSVAIVLDEYGGTAGLLTVEDVVEELFGEIEDEHDKIQLKEEVLKKDTFRFSARQEIDYINETYGLELPEGDAYETLGGLIVSYTENIPDVQEEVKIGNYTIIIEKVSDTKIEEVRIVNNGN